MHIVKAVYDGRGFNRFSDTDLGSYQLCLVLVVVFSM